MKDRIIFSTDKDLRFYLMNYIEKKGTMNQMCIRDRFVSKKIGTFTESISTHPAFFGPSAFIDLIHTLPVSYTHLLALGGQKLCFRKRKQSICEIIMNIFILLKIGQKHVSFK